MTEDAKGGEAQDVADSAAATSEAQRDASAEVAATAAPLKRIDLDDPPAPRSSGR